MPNDDARDPAPDAISAPPSPADPPGNTGAPADHQTPSHGAPALPQSVSPDDHEGYSAADGEPLKPSPRDRSIHGKRMTFALNEAMWEAYRDGQRNMTTLAKMFGMNWKMAQRCVNVGYPVQGFVALKERLRLWDEARFKAQQDAISHAAVVAHDEWAKAKDENLRLVAGHKRTVAHLTQHLLTAVPNAKFTRTKRYRDKEGNWVTYEEPYDAVELAAAMRTIISAKRELSQEESFWLGGPTDRSEVSLSDFGKGWMSLTMEQLQYVIDHQGELPPGVTEEMLYGKKAGVAGLGPPPRPKN